VLVADPGNQIEPDIYGHYVVYRDMRYGDGFGSAIVALDLNSGSKTILNPTLSGDNCPAVGEHRAAWCDRRWNGGFGIVSTVIGSGVEDIIVQSDASAVAVDVNDRWAMWYCLDFDGEKVIRTYSFVTATLGMLDATDDKNGYFDSSAHLDHGSDSVLFHDKNGNYLAMDLATGATRPSTQSYYNRSLNSYWSTSHVWEVSTNQTGKDIYMSHAPEPASFVSLLLCVAGFWFCRRKAQSA
jgi:hypothetical protein